MHPAYFIGLDHSHQCINLVIRGTTDTCDVMTDIVAHCEPFLSGNCDTMIPGQDLQSYICLQLLLIIRQTSQVCA